MKYRLERLDARRAGIPAEDAAVGALDAREGADGVFHARLKDRGERE
jgi:hypothetical protein